jgi:hypothetical protein
MQMSFILHAHCFQVVFLTALFYLLAASGEQYLPAAWFASLTPSQGGAQGNKFGRAVEEAVRLVFLSPN